MKIPKTNAMRLLERSGIAYQAHTYNSADGAIDGMAVAGKTGRDPQQVYKTLASRGASGEVYIFCIPVDMELPLKRAAAAANEKSLAMLPLADVTRVTGYVRGGVSPFAMKKKYRTFVAEAAKAWETVLVSGGQVGLQIELAPEDLVTATEGGWFDAAPDQ